SARRDDLLEDGHRGCSAREHRIEKGRKVRAGDVGNIALGLNRRVPFSPTGSVDTLSDRVRNSIVEPLPYVSAIAQFVVDWWLNRTDDLLILQERNAQSFPD